MTRRPNAKGYIQTMDNETSDLIVWLAFYASQIRRIKVNQSKSLLLKKQYVVIYSPIPATPLLLSSVNSLFPTSDGCLLTCVTYSPWQDSSSSRVNPKSATLHTMFSLTSTFLAARSCETIHHTTLV